MSNFEPVKDCALCPRLVTFRDDNKKKFPDFFNGAVPSFGNDKPRLLIVGLAPGLKGANWSGRPFTGDYAGDLLYECLLESDLAAGGYDRRPDDGLQLNDTLITNAVRCVPPQNKPTSDEINTCRPFLKNLLNSKNTIRVIMVLGRIAHDSTLRALDLKLSAYPFGHNVHHKISSNLTLVDSYHCSRYNVNTGRLTKEMFMDVLKTCKILMDEN